MKNLKMKKYWAVSMVVMMTILLTLSQAFTVLNVYAEEAAESETYGEIEEPTESVSDESEEQLTESETDEEDVENTSAGMTSETEPVSENDSGHNQTDEEWIYKILMQATPEQIELIEDIVLGGINATDEEWIYNILKQATPEQIELIEDIVLGGLNALDKLEIKGFDRVRIWVEHNMATVMAVNLTVALIAFSVVSFLQKRGFAKKADILNSNAIEIYEEGQRNIAEAMETCKAYADRGDEALRIYAERAEASVRAYAEAADKLCRESVEAAEEAAESAKAANGQVTEERAMLIEELAHNARVNKALCEEINFLMQCSDLSQPKRDEAEAIFRQALEGIKHDGSDVL